MKKTNYIQIRCSDLDQKLLLQLSRQAQKNKSEYVRQLIFSEARVNGLLKVAKDEAY